MRVEFVFPRPASRDDQSVGMRPVREEWGSKQENCAGDETATRAHSVWEQSA